jgi:integrase
MPLFERRPGTGMARPRKPTLTLPAHVHRTVARGHEYFTFQQGRGTKAAGPRIKLPHPADEAFWPAYRALANIEAPKAAVGTFAALIIAYRDSPEWKALADKTKTEWLRYHGRIDAKWGPLRVADLEPKHVLALRDKFADTPAAADNLLRSLSSMLSWSVPRGWRSDNPCDHVKKLKGSTPYPSWPWTAIETVRDGAGAELWWACALALYSGQRQGDVLAMKWSDIHEGAMSVVQEKTGCHVAVPVHRDLAPILGAIPKRSVFILTNSHGTPWTKDGFRTSWGKMATKLALPDGLVFHGLRKSAVVMLLEAGCTDAEVSAITGQSRQMVEHYGRQVNQKKLAASAILKWENVENANVR